MSTPLLVGRTDVTMIAPRPGDSPTVGLEVAPAGAVALPAF